mmetsp:Transcript_11526/g.17378  ORF Transcript_11526/g.17378 Transcript_11526/m.17378 type:complete len:98 (-) Transcript_11526:1257-1550(-)
MEELGQEEANYFVGILSKKYHKSTKMKLQRQQEYLNNLAKTKIFKVTKVKREPPLVKQILADPQMALNSNENSKGPETKSEASVRSNPRLVNYVPNL